MTDRAEGGDVQVSCSVAGCDCGTRPIVHSEPAGVGTAVSLATLMEARRLCELGYHAWTPYLPLPPDAANRYVTWCAREGCEAHEQYDL